MTSFLAKMSHFGHDGQASGHVTLKKWNQHTKKTQMQSFRNLWGDAWWTLMNPVLLAFRPLDKFKIRCWLLLKENILINDSSTQFLEKLFSYTTHLQKRCRWIVLWEETCRWIVNEKKNIIFWNPVDKSSIKITKNYLLIYRG